MPSDRWRATVWHRRFTAVGGVVWQYNDGPVNIGWGMIGDVDPDEARRLFKQVQGNARRLAAVDRLADRWRINEL